MDRLDELTAIVDMMREKGVVRLVSLGTEIVLGPPVQKAKAKEQDVDHNLEARREHYEVLLGRGVSDEELRRLP